jgi:hypothetical protein
MAEILNPHSKKKNKLSNPNVTKINDAITKGGAFLYKYNNQGLLVDASGKVVPFKYELKGKDVVTVPTSPKAASPKAASPKAKPKKAKTSSPKSPKSASPEKPKKKTSTKKATKKVASPKAASPKKKPAVPDYLAMLEEEEEVPGEVIAAVEEDAPVEMASVDINKVKQDLNAMRNKQPEELLAKMETVASPEVFVSCIMKTIKHSDLSYKNRVHSEIEAILNPNAQYEEVPAEGSDEEMEELIEMTKAHRISPKTAKGAKTAAKKTAAETKPKKSTKKTATVEDITEGMSGMAVSKPVVENILKNLKAKKESKDKYEAKMEEYLEKGNDKMFEKMSKKVDELTTEMNDIKKTLKKHVSEDEYDLIVAGHSFGSQSLKSYRRKTKSPGRKRSPKKTRKTKKSPMKRSRSPKKTTKRSKSPKKRAVVKKMKKSPKKVARKMTKKSTKKNAITAKNYFGSFYGLQNGPMYTPQGTQMKEILPSLLPRRTGFGAVQQQQQMAQQMAQRQQLHQFKGY